MFLVILFLGGKKRFEEVSEVHEPQTGNFWCLTGQDGKDERPMKRHAKHDAAQG